jgi:hypothetical protein
MTVNYPTRLLLAAPLVLYLAACAPSHQACQKFVLYQQRKVDVEGLKAAVSGSKLPIKVELGSVKADPQSLRDAPEKIQELDFAQFSACQAMNALPEGPERSDASKRWSSALIGLIQALTGPKSPGYSLRFEGSDEGVLASNLKLNLGFVPAGVRSIYKLLVTSTDAPVHLQATGKEAGIAWQWASGKDVEEVTKANSRPLQISVESPDVGPERVALVRLVSTDGEGGDVTIMVRYEALNQTVSDSSQSEQLSGRGQDFSPPYSTCATAPTRGDYSVIANSIVTTLTGDRECNHFSTCQVSIDNDRRRACLIFTLQGHNECGGDCAQRKSIGHIAGRFELASSKPSLVANAL